MRAHLAVRLPDVRDFVCIFALAEFHFFAISEKQRRK